MAARRAKAGSPFDLAAALPALSAALRERHSLRRPELTKAGVPPAHQAAAIERLCAEGFERTKTGVRVPLRGQLLALLAARETLPVGQLAKLVRGATQKEAKDAALALASEGAAHLALRGKAEILASRSAPVVGREQLGALVKACKDLAALGAKALRRPHVTLLREDVRARLLEHVALPPPARPAPERPLVDLVLSELPRHWRSAVGLSFVPAAVRALAVHGVPEVQQALLIAARAGRIELQGESGLNRLTPEELALCPPGPQGSRLSWARLLEAGR